jgi:uridine phosphorylase
MIPRQIPESELLLHADGSVYHLRLTPEHLAPTVFTVGDPDRVATVSRHFDQIDFKGQNREFITHTGWKNGYPVTVISTGMGTDNIEILMTELDALVNVDLQTRQVKEEKTSLKIIRIGTSGSLQGISYGGRRTPTSPKRGRQPRMSLTVFSGFFRVFSLLFFLHFKLK